MPVEDSVFGGDQIRHDGQKFNVYLNITQEILNAPDEWSII